MQKRLGLLLVLIPMIASAALVLSDRAEQSHPQSAPKKLEAPPATPVEPDDAQSQVPQRPPGEVIGIPMLA